MNIHGTHSYWKQGAQGTAGVRRVWAGAGLQRMGAGHIVRPRAQLVMPPPLIGGGIKRYFCLTSVAYIGPKSRTERPRETKIGTEIALVTRDSDPLSRSKGQGHQAALLSAALMRKAAAAVSVGTHCYVASAWQRASHLGANGGGEGWGHIVSPRAQLVIIMLPPLIGGGIKRYFCLTSVCRLSVGSIEPNLRTERPRKTKISTVVTSHVTRAPISRSKGQSHQAALLIAALTLEAGAAVTGGISCRHAHSLFLSTFVMCQFLRPVSKSTSVSRNQIATILDFIGAKGDGGGSDNWSYTTCKAPIKLSPPTSNFVCVCVLQRSAARARGHCHSPAKTRQQAGRQSGRASGQTCPSPPMSL